MLSLSTEAIVSAYSKEGLDHGKCPPNSPNVLNED